MILFVEPDVDDEGLGTSKIVESWAETKCGACKETLRPLRIMLHILQEPEKVHRKLREFRKQRYL